jgi:hypothetical protein
MSAERLRKALTVKEISFCFSYGLKMAPTGRNNALTDDKKRQISDIPDLDDLDSASTSSRAEFNRSSSYNIPLVCRAATSVAIATKENDEINALENTDIRAKVYPDVLEYGKRTILKNFII